MAEKFLGSFRKKKGTTDVQRKAVVFYKAYTQHFSDMMYELRCNIAGKSDVDPGFLSKIGSCVDSATSLLPFDAPGIAASYLLAALSMPNAADGEIVGNIKRLASAVLVAPKDVDVLAHEAALQLISRYGVQISLLEDDSLITLAQVAFARAFEYMGASTRPWTSPTLEHFTDGARIGRSKQWISPYAKSKVKSTTGNEWIAEELLGRSSVCHDGNLLIDQGDEGISDQFGPMKLEDERDPSSFFAEEPEVSMLGEHWAGMLFNAATMIKLLPTAPVPNKKKRPIDDLAQDLIDKRVFNMTSVADQELLPKFTGAAKKQASQSTNQIRQQAHRVSIDVRKSVRLTFIVDKENHNLPPVGSFYQDRANVAQDISKILGSAGRVVVSGPAGCGKSQLALQFAHNSLVTRAYHLIWRFECQNSTMLELSYRGLAEMFNMDVLGYTLAQIILKVHMRLTNDPALYDWLLIYDDVPSESHLISFLSNGFPERKVTHASHILITSAGAKWTRSQALLLAGYVDAEAGVYLFRALPGTAKEERDELGSRLKAHPLSLALAAGFVKQTSVPISSFLAQFDERLKALSSKKFDDAFVPITRAVVGTIFAELEKRGAVASAIADHIAYLSPAIVKEEVIMAFLRTKGADSMLGPGVLLCETVKLLTRASGEGTNAFTMHDLIREARQDATQADADVIGTTWMSILTYAFDQSQPVTRDLLKQRESLLPHVEHLTERWVGRHGNPSLTLPVEVRDEWLQLAQLLFSVTLTCDVLKMEEHVLFFSEKVLSIRKELLGPQHESIAEVIECQATVYRTQGNLEKASALYEMSYSLLSAIFGDEHPSVAPSVHGLADIYLAQQQHKKAQSGFETALRIRQKAFGQRHESVADSMEGIALLLMAQGLHQKAIPMMEEVLSIRRKVLGETHPKVAKALVTLARLEEKSEEIGQAIARFEEAIKIYEQAYTKDHPSVFEATLGLVDIYTQSDPDSALKYLRPLLKLRKIVYGLKHKDVSLVLIRIGACMESIGDSVQALASYEEALDSFQQQKTPPCVEIADTLNSIANLHRTLGDYPKALHMFDQALNLRKKLFGNDHQDVAVTYNNIAVVYDSQGNFAKALELYQDALRIYKAILPKNHPDIGTTIHNMACLHDANGDYRKAVAMYDDALRIRKAALGKTHPDVAATMNSMAGLYESQKEFSKALKLYEDALKIRKAALGPEHPDVASTLNNMAGVYVTQKKYQKAIALYEDSLRIRKEAFGEDHPDVATTLTNLALVFDERGDVQRALAMYEQALDIFVRKLGKDHQYTIQTEKLILGVKADING